MSIGKLLAVLFLVAIDRASASYRRYNQVSSEYDENHRAQKFLPPKKGDDIIYYPGENPVVSVDDDTAYRRLLFVGDSSPRTEKLGAGLTIFGIPIGAEIGYTKIKHAPKRPSRNRVSDSEEAGDLDEQERPFDDDDKLIRIPTKQRMVITKQKIHTIKRDQGSRRASFVPYDQGRRAGGLELFEIPIGSQLVYERDDGAEAVSDNGPYYLNGETEDIVQYNNFALRFG